MSTLVIVESPTKAKTIRNYLPSGYLVQASMGHVRDLPASANEIPAAYKGEEWAGLGVNVKRNFEPIYVVPKTKQKIVKELKEALKVASEVVLATDEDREGESISWHLLQVLQPKVPVKRMVFHEITKEAIQRALKNCRSIDENLVHAQETRRILDRLVGYTLSPLLWKKIAYGLSAGRVQSVAVRLLVQREKERIAFKNATYWDLKASLEKEGYNPFEAKLVTLGGKKLATGSDFNPTTGQILPKREVILLNEAEAIALKERLLPGTWRVVNTEERPTTRKPYPPFTTSTLQQEANRKLGLSARDTMRTAQDLYEKGYITYMRTDSVHLSDEAIAAARACVEKMYGKEYLSPKPKQYTTKSKGAQEAHEAIRPAGATFRTPQETGLSGRELNLYDLIWKRTVACQMADARLTQIIVNIEVDDAGFRASGQRINFAGFFRAYVEGSDDPEAALDDREVILPPLSVGDIPKCLALDPLKHETQPPARYSEATLVKTLESEGIGRPSTYASIISTILDRGYAQLRNKALIPTFTAFAVTHLLEGNFSDLVNTNFTSKMEQTLDEIATGEAKWLPYLEQFYLGEQGLETQVKVQESQIDASVAKAIKFDNINGVVKIGRFGAYIEVPGDDGVLTASIPPDLTPADLTEDKIEVLLRQKLVGPDQLGTHPETGEPIFVLVGNYGPYLQLGEKTDTNPKPKRVSLPKGKKPEDVSLDFAVGLLALPRSLGVDPGTGGKIQASLGQYGPYVVCDRGKEGKEYRSIKEPDNVLTISLERALELLAQPKAGRSASRTQSKPPLRELGVHPDDQEPVNIYEGPYGIYIKHGKVNVGIPEGETPEKITLETALKLLAAKAGNQKTTKSASSSKTKTKTEATTKKSTAGTTKKSPSSRKK